MLAGQRDAASFPSIPLFPPTLPFPVSCYCFHSIHSATLLFCPFHSFHLHCHSQSHATASIPYTLLLFFSVHSSLSTYITIPSLMLLLPFHTLCYRSPLPLIHSLISDIWYHSSSSTDDIFHTSDATLLLPLIKVSMPMMPLICCYWLHSYTSGTGLPLPASLDPVQRTVGCGTWILYRGTITCAT